MYVAANMCLIHYTFRIKFCIQGYLACKYSLYQWVNIFFRSLSDVSTSKNFVGTLNTDINPGSWAERNSKKYATAIFFNKMLSNRLRTCFE